MSVTIHLEQLAVTNYAPPYPDYLLKHCLAGRQHAESNTHREGEIGAAAGAAGGN